MPLYRISGPDDQPRRKVNCPADQIKAQLAAGETYAEINPMTDGIGAVVIEILPVTEDSLLAQVDAGRETAQMTLMTAGGAKKYVYNRKAVEAIDARALVASALNALALTEKKRRYPFASAEAAITGEALSVVLARYDTAMTASSAKIAAIEAQAQKAKRDIRAATTIAAKQAASNVQWAV